MSKGSSSKLVVSFKSSSVELSVIEFTQKKANVLLSKKETLLFKEAVNSSTFIEKSLKALKKILKENNVNLIKRLNGSNDCEIIFHSPWYLPELISETNKGEKVSLKKFFLEKVKPPKQKDYRQVENKITSILLNGYHLTKLKDIDSKDIEINLYRSYVSKETVKKIEELIGEEVKQINNFDYSTSVMQSYESLKQLFLNEDNLIFLNIGGEITEIGIVEDDILISAMTVPMGSHKFSRELDIFTSEQNSLGSLQFLGDEKTDEKTKPAVEKKIREMTDNWTLEILETLNENKKEYPRKMFIISNSDTTKFFQMILNESPIKDFFDFHFLTKDVFEGKVEVLESKPNKHVEYLLSAYYLSIKS